MKYSYQLCLLGLFIQLFPGVAYAQILPDSTVGTKLTPNALINGDRIDGGALRGSNLFHSFQEFNINAGRSVFFTNPADVTNIFTRVTGTNPSNINGTLGVLGNANLFFMNPNGIVFGTAGRLDVKGSFLGTTASSINFADGSVFSTSPNSPTPTPLLSVSVPVGLGFGSNPGAIQVQGTGHNLTSSSFIFSPYTSPNPTTTGLQVQPGKTLALVGSEVNLNGGILTAPGGRIEVGSVGATSQVNLNPATWGFTLDYTKVPILQNIQLSRQALLNVSGSTALSAGSIQLQGKRISLTDGSTLWSQNRGTQASGDINVRATELLELSGTNLDEKIRSGIMSETLGRGASSNINISTAKLTMQNGTVINSKTFGLAPSGNININATDTVQMRGLSPKTRAYNVIGSMTTFTSGSQNKPIPTAKAGDVTISTSNLIMQNASYISAISFGDSVGGDITINTDTAEIIGRESNLAGNLDLATTISSVSYGRGNSGKVTFNTRELALRDGGMITTSSIGTSNAGNVTVTATEKIQVEGLASNISSTVGSLAPDIQRISFYRAIGNGGNITINTPSLSVSDKAGLSVANFGTGDAGTLTINSDSIQLNNQALITATINNGLKGNIDLRANNLQLLNNSLITTNTIRTNTKEGGTGNAANITINSDTIIQLENSNITANAPKGQGGNINITTQGLFASPNSKITATGASNDKNGIVNINILGINQESSLQKQSSNFVSTNNVVASSCLASRNAEQGAFLVTGNGGLAETPDGNLDLPYELVQIQSVNSYNAANSIKQASTSWKIGDPVVEAQSLQVVDGRVLLTTASVGEKLPQTSDLTCE